MTSPRRKAKDRIKSITIAEGMALEGKFNPLERPREMEHRLRKDFWTFVVKDLLAYLVALVLILGVSAYCFWTLFQRDLTREDRQWAMSVLASLLTALVGFAFGKVAK